MENMAHLEYLMKRLRTSSAYFYFSIFQLVLCLSLLAYVTNSHFIAPSIYL